MVAYVQVGDFRPGKASLLTVTSGNLLVYKGSEYPSVPATCLRFIWPLPSFFPYTSTNAANHETCGPIATAPVSETPTLWPPRARDGGWPCMPNLSQ